MYSLKNHITDQRNRVVEHINPADMDKALGLIISYLEKRLGGIHKMPGVEHFKNSHGEGYGLRYFLANGRSFRLNWRGKPGSARDITSVDIWTGKSHDPDVEVQAVGVSLTKVLPSLADLILRPEVGDLSIVAESGATEVDHYAFIVEARAGLDPNAVYDEMIDLFMTRKPFSAYQISQFGRTTGQSLWRKILRNHEDLFTVESSGAKTWYTLKPGAKVSSFNKDQILQAVVSLHSDKGASNEQFTSEEIRRAEAEARVANALPYEEQLEDLEQLVKAVIAGASNALFVGGVGGSGKTYRVEKALGAMGMEDGGGYFKNTTSASASAMYRTLYDHRTGIILFDDCDAVFKDQESRNLLKAATDTRRDRKLSWNKSGSWLYKGDPAYLEAQEDEKNDSGEKEITGEDEDKLYPKYFTFRGRIIFITNLQMDQIDPDGALRTRGFAISINPTNDELVNFMEKIALTIKLEDGLTLSNDMRKQVVDLIKNGRNKSDINLRKLIRGMNMAAAKIPNWESLIERYA
jgi:hypothetical protein